MKKCVIVLALVLSAGCRSAGTKPGETFSSCELHYARGFVVDRQAGYTLVGVRNPWDTLSFLQRYVLVPADRELPDSLPEGVLVRTPLERVVAFSSPQCAVLDYLGLGDCLVGISESRYVAIPALRERIASGRIVDVGESQAPDVEKIIDLAPQMLLTTPIEGLNYGRTEKIGIPLLEITDYMEQTPLGRAEWIRFYALFFGCEERADSLFAQTAAAYNELKERIAGTKERPRVLSEKKYGSVWYVPGGESYMAHLFRDAGADYPWADDPRAGSLALSFEHVLEQGVDADVWLFKYNRAEDMTCADLRAEYDGYARFKAFKERNVYGCNTQYNAYYEETPLRPDWLLADMTTLFHPELLPEYVPRYFRKLHD